MTLLLEVNYNRWLTLYTYRWLREKSANLLDINSIIAIDSTLLLFSLLSFERRNQIAPFFLSIIDMTIQLQGRQMTLMKEPYRIFFPTKKCLYGSVRYKIIQNLYISVQKTDIFPIFSNIFQFMAFFLFLSRPFLKKVCKPSKKSRIS